MPEEVEVMSELDLQEASEELLRWAKDNIRENPDTRCQLLADFKDMIYSRGECNPCRTDDAFLLRFLRSRKFSLEGAYRLFINYHDFKEENPTYVEGVGFEVLELAGKYDVINVPPYLNQDGQRILLFKLGNWDPAVFTTDDMFRAAVLILELAILEEKSQICGGICIVDCSNITMQQVLHLTPSVVNKIMQVSVTSHPMKLQAMHIVNQSWIFDTIFNMFKPLLHEKMKERIFFHGNDMESLHKHVDPKRLPQIYGGMQPYYDYNDWVEGFKRSKKVVTQLRTLGYQV